jgi:hypothetical protein
MKTVHFATTEVSAQYFTWAKDRQVKFCQLLAYFVVLNDFYIVLQAVL